MYTAAPLFSLLLLLSLLACKRRTFSDGESSTRGALTRPSESVEVLDYTPENLGKLELKTAYLEMDESEKSRAFATWCEVGYRRITQERWHVSFESFRSAFGPSVDMSEVMKRTREVKKYGSNPPQTHYYFKVDENICRQFTPEYAAQVKEQLAISQAAGAESLASIAKLVIDPQTDFKKLSRKYSMGRSDQAVAAMERFLASYTKKSASPSASLDLVALLPRFVRKSNLTFAEDDGPNCHNSAFCSFEPVHWKTEYLDPSDVLAKANQKGLVKVKKSQPLMSGDLLVYFESKGRPTSAHHTAVLISREKDGNDLVFTKNGFEVSSPYVVQKKTWVERNVYFPKGEFMYVALRLPDKGVTPEAIEKLGVDFHYCSDSTIACD